MSAAGRAFAVDLPPAPAAAAPARSPVRVSLVGKAVEFVTLALLATLVPRLLGPVAYGQFALALTIVTIASVSMALGGPLLMARYVPAAAPDRRAAVARALGARLARWRLGQLAAVVTGGAALAVLAPQNVDPLVTALVLSALALSVGATLALQVGLGLGRTTPWSLRYPLENSVLVVAAVGLHAAAGPAGAVTGIVLASATALGLGLFTIAGPLRQAARGAPIPPGALRFGALQAASGALVQVVHRGGIVAVALLAGSSAETGFAALALGVGLAASYVITQVFLVSLPALAQQIEQDAAAGEEELRRLARRALALLVPILVGAALVAEPAVAWVLGERFAAAADALGPALALVALAPASALGSQVAALRLQPETTFAAALAGAAAFLVAALLLVPPLGAAGGAAAALCGVAASLGVFAVRLEAVLHPGLVASSLGGVALVLSPSVLT